MQSTLQTRLRLSDVDSQLPNRIAGLYGTMKHKLYARVAADGGKANSHKTEFYRQYDISARTFSALALGRQGLIDGTRELIHEEHRSLAKAIHHPGAQLSARRVQIAPPDLQR
ncbi:hypothetical protein [Paraburkholderia sp. GAS42]|uniref:hypothetical protein n=1 Tax=Paraburkholderia sp. GAS42 TaxID=3035135 RepID=UPI003D22FAD1